MGWTPEQLADAIDRATDIEDDVIKVVDKGGLNVKNGWRDNAKETAGQHAPAYPYSISYDPPGKGVSRFRGSAGVISTEIGPDKGKAQGALGNLLEYGSANNPPHNDGKRAADDEAPRFEKHLLQAVVSKLW